jgi:hypothetical protein
MRYPRALDAVLLASAIACALPLSAHAQARLAAPRTVSPGNDKRLMEVEGRCPTFSWSRVDGATAYELAVHDVGGEALTRVIDQPLPADAGSWTPDRSRCLVPDRSYAWSIRALGDDGAASEWSAPALFVIRPLAESSAGSMPDTAAIDEAGSAARGDAARGAVVAAPTKFDPATPLNPVLRTGPLQSLPRVAVAPDGSFLLTTIGRERQLMVYRCDTVAACWALLPVPAVYGNVTSTGPTTNGGIVFPAQGYTLIVWLSEGKPQALLCENPVCTVATSRTIANRQSPVRGDFVRAMDDDGALSRREASFRAAHRVAGLRACGPRGEPARWRRIRRLRQPPA